MSERSIMNGKPVFTVPARSIINFKSHFDKKLLCDGMTFTAGDACVFVLERCLLSCYVESNEKEKASVRRRAASKLQRRCYNRPAWIQVDLCREGASFSRLSRLCLRASNSRREEAGATSEKRRGCASRQRNLFGQQAEKFGGEEKQWSSHQRAFKKADRLATIRRSKRNHILRMRLRSNVSKI